METSLLEEKTAIVTGSGRGIGRAIALELGAHSANVVVTARTAEEIEDTAQTIRDETSGTAISIAGDITDREHVDRLFDETVTEFDGLDILVNNAGVGYPFDVTEDSLSDMYELIEVDLYAAVDCALHAVTEFQQADRDPGEITGSTGRILNISSLASRFDGYSMPYTIANAGLEGMTRALAVQLAPDDVLVNAIAPGFIRTSGTVDHEGEITVPEQFESEEAQRYYFEQGRIPQRRLGEPEAIARLARFLVSPENTYMTGQTICVGGGASVSA